MFALTKGQYRYFRGLAKNLKFWSKVIFFPNLYISPRGLKLLKNIDTKAILNLKLKEVDIKYPNQFINFSIKNCPNSNSLGDYECPDFNQILPRLSHIVEWKRSFIKP